MTVGDEQGMLDAEGSVGMYRSGGSTALSVANYNTDVQLLSGARDMLVRLNHHPLRPYLDKERGFRSPGFKIEMKKDYWRVVLASFDDARALLSELPLRHEEKVAKKELALTLSHRESWTAVQPRVESIWRRIRAERNQFVTEAKRAVDERLRSKATAALS